MSTGSFRAQLADYVLSGHSFLHCPTTEATRFLSELRLMADKLPDGGRQVLTWSHATGWRDANDNPPSLPEGVQNGPPDPQRVPQEILDLPENSIFVLKDFGFYLHLKTYNYADIVVAWLCEIRDVLASTGRTVLFVGTDMEIPPALEHEITTVEFRLPDDASIERTIRFVGDGHPLDEDAVPALVTACRGLTEQQVEDRVALALRRYKRLGRDAAGLILNEKAQVIRRTGLLDYRDPPEGGLDLLGGWENVKRHVQLDKPCFSPEARKFGIEFPRGLLLVGVSGAGKTQMTLAIASYLQLPLIALDVGSLMSKWIGESERNMRSAIRLLEGLGSCVLQLDEVEKGFGGVGGEHDGGSAQRCFGVFLKWLSDRTCPIYVVATANNIRALPVEFTRKGRFDELYGVHLPTVAERMEILGIHLKLRGRDASCFDLDVLADKCDGYTGADLKEVVQLGLKLAFSASVELSMDHLLAAIPEVRPLSKTDPEAVAALTSWLDAHTKPAGTGRATIAPSTVNGRSRRRRVTTTET